MSVVEQPTAAMSEQELTLFDAAPDVTIMRRCPQCGGEKSLATAYRRRGDGGYRKECRTCQHANERAWRKKQGPKYRRDTTQWELYRLRPPDYEEILARQGNACAICRKPFGDDPRRIQTDHKHGCDHPDKGRTSCRKCVRGVLCRRCNFFVGWIETDYRHLGDLLHYLGVDGGLIFCQVIRDVGYELLSTGEDARAEMAAADHG